MARQFTNTYLPRPERLGQRFTYLNSSVIGTGGTTVADSATTTVPIESPRIRGYVNAISIRGSVAAISASGTVLVTVYKRDVANAANVALNTAFSIEADGLTTLNSALNVPLVTSLTDAQRTVLEADTLYAEIVTTNTVGTAPVRVQVSVELAQTR